MTGAPLPQPNSVDFEDDYHLEFVLPPDLDDRRDEEEVMRLQIAALYAEPRHPLLRRLWDKVVIKVCAYICNYSNRPVDPHDFARGQGSVRACRSALRLCHRLCRTLRSLPSCVGLAWRLSLLGSARAAPSQSRSDLHPRRYSHKATLTREQIATFAQFREGRSF